MAVLNAARRGGLAFLFELPEPGKEDVDLQLLETPNVLIGKKFVSFFNGITGRLKSIFIK